MGKRDRRSRSHSKTEFRSPGRTSKRSRRDLECEIRELKERLNGRHSHSRSAGGSRRSRSGSKISGSRSYDNRSTEHRSYAEKGKSPERYNHPARPSRNRYCKSLEHARKPKYSPEKRGNSPLHKETISYGSLERNYLSSSPSGSISGSEDRLPSRDRGLSQETEVSDLDQGSKKGDEQDDIVIIHEEEPLEDEILKVLGEKDESPQAFTLHSVLQKRWTLILEKGLSKEERTELFGSHSIPSNLQTLNPPHVNMEIISAVPDSAIKTDKFYINRQAQLGKAIAALGQALNMILNKDFSGDQRTEITRYLGDAGKILTDLHYRLSLSRRMLIMPHLDKTVKEISTKIPVGEFLFGSNIGEKIKSAKALQKTATDLKVNTQKKPIGNKNKNSLNYRGPPRLTREPRYQRANLRKRKFSW